jgi:hypothetical protein
VGRGPAVEVDQELAVVVSAVLAAGVLERERGGVASRIVGEVDEAVAVVVEAVAARGAFARGSEAGRPGVHTGWALPSVGGGVALADYLISLVGADGIEPPTSWV